MQVSDNCENYVQQFYSQEFLRRVVEHVSTSKTTAGANHVQKIMSIMQSSPTAGYLQDCSLHERIMLAALIKCVKREGVEEIKWSDVSLFYLTQW